MVVQDAEAHAYAFDWMGSSCKKSCPCCWSIVGKQCNFVKTPKINDSNLYFRHPSLPSDIKCTFS